VETGKVMREWSGDGDKNLLSCHSLAASISSTIRRKEMTESGLAGRDDVLHRVKNSITPLLFNEDPPPRGSLCNNKWQTSCYGANWRCDVTDAGRRRVMCRPMICW